MGLGEKKIDSQTFRFWGPCGTGHLPKVLHRNIGVTLSPCFSGPGASGEDMRAHPWEMGACFLKGLQPQPFYSVLAGAPEQAGEKE